MQNLYRLTALSFSFVVLFAFLGCTPEEPLPKNEPQKIQIIASFYPLAYFAERIGGDFAEVQNLSGQKDLHDFEITPKDFAKMESADMVVLQGGGMESWGEDTTKRLRESGRKVFVVGEHISFVKNEPEGEEVHQEDHEDEIVHEEGHDEGHQHGAFNSHTWLSPSLSKKTVEAMLEMFVASDPKNKEEYQNNAKIFIAELDELDLLGKKTFSSCEKNMVIVGHNAFLYLANAYGFTTFALSGISTSDSPSAKELLEAKKIVESQNIQYVFGEENESNRFSETLAKETSTKLLLLDPLEMEKPENSSYTQRMKENFSSLAIALQCQ